MHFLPLLEQKVGALDQAAPLQGWDLPDAFVTLHRFLETLPSESYLESRQNRSCESLCQHALVTKTTHNVFIEPYFCTKNSYLKKLQKKLEIPLNILSFASYQVSNAAYIFRE